MATHKIISQNNSEQLVRKVHVQNDSTWLEIRVGFEKVVCSMLYRQISVVLQGLKNFNGSMRICVYTFLPFEDFLILSKLESQLHKIFFKIHSFPSLFKPKNVQLSTMWYRCWADWMYYYNYPNLVQKAHFLCKFAESFDIEERPTHLNFCMSVNCSTKFCPCLKQPVNSNSWVHKKPTKLSLELNKF